MAAKEPITNVFGTYLKRDGKRNEFHECGRCHGAPNQSTGRSEVGDAVPSLMLATNSHPRFWACHWLYVRFTPNYRDVEKLLGERGLVVSLRDYPSMIARIRSSRRSRLAANAAATDRSLKRF